MSEWPFIIAAYSITWIALGGFAIYLSLRDAKTREP
jgi:CcmD family protein